MNVNDIMFSDNLEMYISIPEESHSINLVIADYLELAEQDLSVEYKQKIIKMIGQSGEWYSLGQNRIFDDLSEKGELMSIFLLSEQTEDEFVIGLLFRVEIDVEHGRGMKISLNSMSILKYGIGEVAFI
ncbi:hypothetical protein [Basfia succiniciproducens]|uniref:Uncharacterized protein n=1 Tax=Basfia succiniciproducens TaxID=653940 RepID=A0A1G5BR89_9PAST|nr:hypothetical protein [Basfia succiniciproducens]QIM68350.1 hypothetical protein A4G13_02535 [Basfia succiniciproducens]SCX92729.1 hypothetical protein SAMN02910354_00865 [Basfia succiniciproducens]